ncbi:VCBS repeat-containing protein [Streptomyces sp. NPDC006270]|uniref:VCBS repeat-containing protein n=1 Tax=Streptomyces sp. NPDC006270 TaxID=3364741 RepID=UPI0036BE0FC3
MCRYKLRGPGPWGLPTALSLALALALTAPLAGTQSAAADEKPPKPSSQEHTPEETRALAKAADTGEPVEILSHRTETAETFANPEGSFTTDQYALAQRVRKGGKLVDIDTALARNSDGTLSTKATEVGVTFSGGGDGPLATVSRDGRSMSWSWPGELPSPQVDGDTVIYRNVLDDVDLKLKAGTAGFGQLLVVHNEKAAGNPALAQIKLPLEAVGLTVNADEHGNLRALNPAGQEIFTAPTPMMWDSNRPPMARSADHPSPPSPAHEFEAPYGAREGAVGVALDDGHLSLTPDPDILRGDDTQYPVYIDPAVSGSREAWTIAYSSAPSTAFYNGNGWDEGDGNKVTSSARVGNPGDGTSRSFFRMDTNNLWNTNKVISSSTFRIKNSYSYSCTHREVQLWRTGSISSSTTWSKQPSWYVELAAVSDAKGYSSSCPAGNLAFNATAGAKQAASSRWNNLTLGLRATTESDRLAYKRFDAKSAVLSTTYNTVPNAPSALDTIPSTKNSAGCGNTAPYGLIGNTDIYLTAKGADKDGGTVRVKFHLWPTGHHPNDDPNGVIIVNTTVSVTSGTVAKLKVTKASLQPHLATANGNFSWKAQTSDGTLTSDWTPTKGAPGCRFVFDPNRPSTPPGVTSGQFPDGSDGWPVTTGTVRSEGTFAITSGGVADVTRYEYWSDWDATRRTAAPGAAGGSVSVKLTPTVAGANQLYVRSLDKVGNYSDTTTYLFYANGPKTPDKPGDLNGDGNADLWAVDQAGTLYPFFGAGDGTVAKAAFRSTSIDFTGAQISHRGDWTGDGYEDLITLRPEGGANRLWMHPNNGAGYACSACENGPERQELTVYDPANDHWSGGVKQILAVGDVDGGMDTDGDGTEDIPGFSDLIVNDGEYIWLYYGAPDYRLDSHRDPVLLAGPDDPIAESASTVNEVTLAAAGDYNGDGRADLVVRYDRPDVGGLYVFHGDETDNGFDISLTDRTAVSYNWGVNTVPHFTAAPDANNNGKLDLWATTPGTGRVRFFADYTSSGHTALTVASEAFLGYQTIG